MRRRLVVAGLAAAMAVTGAVRADAVAVMRAVRHIAAPASTRLIVEFSAPVHYRLRRLLGRPELGVPARLYVDFPRTRLATSARAPIILRRGPLLRMRATQRTAASTRLILDVPGLTDVGVFAMLDPFRLIIDVRGRRRAGSVAPAPPRGERSRRAARGGGPRRSVVAPLPRRNRRQRARPTPAPRAHRRVKLVLDPGHGGKDPGAMGVGGIAEKDIVLAIALQLKKRLAAATDIDVVLTRDTDTFLPLEERTARANAEQADLFISIHANASPNPKLSGTETYYLNNTHDRATIRLAKMENGLRTVTNHSGGERDVSLILSDLIQSYKIQESVGLAEQVQHALVRELHARGSPVNDLGVKQGPFYVLVGAGMPCVLVEVAFLTNPREGRRLARRRYQEGIAEGLLHGIRRFVENTRIGENL
ncbi:MAG: N-acetylmuramoyl-L-alanine amidase [Candidatus Binatia bacterium]